MNLIVGVKILPFNKDSHKYRWDDHPQLFRSLDSTLVDLFQEGPWCEIISSASMQLRENTVSSQT